MAYYRKGYGSRRRRDWDYDTKKNDPKYEVVVLPVEGEEDRTGEIVIKTKVVGVTYEGRQSVIANMSEFDELDLVRNRNNGRDKNAIAVFYEDDQIGFLCKELAEKLAPLMDEGKEFSCEVSEITGGKNGLSYGVNIEIRQEGDTDENLFLHRFF